MKKLQHLLLITVGLFTVATLSGCGQNDPAVYGDLNVSEIFFTVGEKSIYLGSTLSEVIEKLDTQGFSLSEGTNNYYLLAEGAYLAVGDTAAIMFSRWDESSDVLTSVGYFVNLRFYNPSDEPIHASDATIYHITINGTRNIAHINDALAFSLLGQFPLLATTREDIVNYFGEGQLVDGVFHADGTVQDAFESMAWVGTSDDERLTVNFIVEKDDNYPKSYGLLGSVHLRTRRTVE